MGDPLMNYLEDEPDADSTTVLVGNGSEDDDNTLNNEKTMASHTFLGTSLSDPDLRTKASMESSKSSEQARSSIGVQTSRLEDFRKKLKDSSPDWLRPKKSSQDIVHRTTSLPERVPEEPTNAAPSIRIGVIDATQLLPDDETMPELQAGASSATTNEYEHRFRASWENRSRGPKTGSDGDSDSDGPP